MFEVGFFFSVSSSQFRRSVDFSVLTVRVTEGFPWRSTGADWAAPLTASPTHAEPILLPLHASKSKRAILSKFSTMSEKCRPKGSGSGLTQDVERYERYGTRDE